MEYLWTRSATFSFSRGIPLYVVIKSSGGSLTVEIRQCFPLSNSSGCAAVYVLGSGRVVCYRSELSCFVSSLDSCEIKEQTRVYVFFRQLYCLSLDIWFYALYVSIQVGFTLSQATKALRESRSIALLYF